MERLLSLREVKRIAIVDAGLITIALLIPALAHVIGPTARFLEPMRIALLGAIILVTERKNAYLLSLALPWISFSIVGMPVLWKASLMSIELLFNTLILYYILTSKINPALAAIISIVLSKLMYYGLKYICITTGILPPMDVFGAIYQQIIPILLLALLFWAGYRLANNRTNMI